MAQRILALEFAGDRVRAAVAERIVEFVHAGRRVRQGARRRRSRPRGALSRLVAEAGQPDIVISALPARSRRQAPARSAVQGCAPAASGGAVRAGRASARSRSTMAPSRSPGSGARASTRWSWPRWCARPTSSTISICCRRRDSIPRLSRWRRSRWPPCSRARSNGNGDKPVAHLVVEGDEGSTSVVLVDPDGTPRALRSMQRRADDVGRLGGLAGCGDADSQLGASDPARTWRGDRTDRGDRRRRGGGVSQGARPAVRFARHVGARRRRLRLHRPLRRLGAEHRQVFVVCRDAARRVAGRAGSN